MPFEIRPFHPSDLPSLYKICLLTADNGRDASSQYECDELVGHFFSAPYAIMNPDMCFIATCDGEPCGYIVGTDNSKQFSERCEGEWLPALRERYPLEQYKGKSASDWVVNKIHEGNAPRPEFDAYPAHFHINCLPETQGFGVGRKLIMTLIERLMASKISGVHLEVSTVNTGAITFYEKLGFTQIATFEHSLGYGMELCAQ